MIASFLQLLFPPRCFGCGKQAVSFCERCIKLSRKTLSTPHLYTTAVFDFKDPLIKRAIHAMKYYHRRDLVAPLTGGLAEQLRDLPDVATYVLVPIPMPRMRKLLRGYNQAELIAFELSRILSIPVRTDLLVRAKSPRRQVKTVTREARIQNQHGSFGAPENLDGVRCLLIDDVTTTGATLAEARNVLLKKGAGNVRAATLAH